MLFTGFFILEGFDYGVGILLPFLTKEDKERRMLINAIGPFWDANEVWLITAGGAMFAAFPHWYATLFSGFYVALVLMLLALIVRGVGFEFRSKEKNPQWRRLWDSLIFVGSAIPALLWGVAMANIIRGVPIDENMTFIGNLLTLLNPFALLAGLSSLALFTLHGAIFLNLKVGGDLKTRAAKAGSRFWPVAALLSMASLGIGTFITDLVSRKGILAAFLPLIALIAILAVGWFLRNERPGRAFVMTTIGIAFSTISIFVGLFPRVMVSSLNEAWSLTIYNASSSPYTLKVMSIVALIFVPIVLVYQGWSYWTFRKRITRETPLEY